MPSRVGIDPSRQYTEIEPEIRRQYQTKSWYKDLRLSEAKGLYVSNSPFQAAPEAAIRHEKMFRESRQKMIAAGREIENRLKDAINREFPHLRPKGQTLGDYALSRAQDRKLDAWADHERQRIEELAGDKRCDNKDIEFPYQLNRVQKKALLGEKLTATEKEQLLESALTDEQKAALTSRVNNGDRRVVSPDLWALEERESIERQLNNPRIRIEDIRFSIPLDSIQQKLLLDEELTETEKEYILKSTLTEEQRATLTSSYDGFFLSYINNRVLEGLDVSAQLERNVELQNAARDHLMILKARDLNPEDAISAARHAQRHRIVEENRLLRNAIANDLARNPNYASRAEITAEAIVSNLQTSSEVLTPSNLMKALQILKSLGGGTEQVEALGDLRVVERVLRGTIPFAHALNESIERSARGPEFDAERTNIKHTIGHSNFALEGAATLLNDMQAFDQDARAQMATRLMDSAVSSAELCNRPLFKNAAAGSSAQKLAEKLAEQARIANELAQALMSPSGAAHMPSLKQTAAPEAHQPGDAALASTSKEREAKRLLTMAIADDLRSSGAFPGNGNAANIAAANPDIAAANIAALLPANQPTLTVENIAKVQYLLNCLRLSNGYVSQLTNHVEVDNTLSVSIPQIQDLNQETIAAIKSIGGDALDRYHLLQFANIAFAANTERAIEDAKGFLASGRFDDDAQRLHLFNRLKRISRGCERTLQHMEREIRHSAPQAKYARAVQALDAQMAAVCDLAQQLYPSNENEVLSRTMEAFYSQDARDPSRLRGENIAVLDERVEAPSIIFCSDAHRLKSHEALEEPLNQYNTLIDRVKGAIESFKRSRIGARLDELRMLISQALTSNAHVIGAFQSVNQLRKNKNDDQYDEEIFVLEAQRGCLQALQANALRVNIPQYQRTLATLAEEDDGVEEEWRDLPSAFASPDPLDDILADERDMTRIEQLEVDLLEEDGGASPVGKYAAPTTPSSGTLSDFPELSDADDVSSGTGSDDDPDLDENIAVAIKADLPLQGDDQTDTQDIDAILKQQGILAEKQQNLAARRRKHLRMNVNPTMETFSESIDAQSVIGGPRADRVSVSASEPARDNRIIEELDETRAENSSGSDDVAVKRGKDGKRAVS